MSPSVAGLLGVVLGGVITFGSAYFVSRWSVVAQRSENRRTRQSEAYAEALWAFEHAVDAAARFATVHVTLGPPELHLGPYDSEAHRERAEFCRSEWRSYQTASLESRRGFSVTYLTALLVSGDETPFHLEPLESFLSTRIYAFSPWTTQRSAEQLAPTSMPDLASDVMFSVIERIKDAL